MCGTILEDGEVQPGELWEPPSLSDLPDGFWDGEESDGEEEEELEEEKSDEAAFSDEDV